MGSCKQIDPNLLSVYASLVFVIGALITLAASIIVYKSGQPETSVTADIAGIDRSSLLVR